MPKARIDDTLEMVYEDYDFADPWRPHETVVLHHGNSKNHKLWYRWIPILARHYRVVALDARGFGESTVPPPGYPWSLSNFAKDIRGLLDFLSLDRVHLIGETVGGTFSLQFAYEYPERLRSLTVCTSPYKFAGAVATLEGAKLIEEQGIEAWVRSSMANRVDPAKGSDPGHAEWYAREMMKTTPRVTIETLRYLTSVDMTPILPQIKVPTLIIMAESAGLGNGAEMQKLIPGSKLVVIPGASGFVQHTAPEQCAEAWLKFARGLAPAG